jgi:hypothetical protein
VVANGWCGEVYSGVTVTILIIILLVMVIMVYMVTIGVIYLTNVLRF